MGLGAVGSEYLAAIRGNDQFDLVAVADADPGLLRRHVEASPVRAYEDYRSLIVETERTGLDLLFVALEPFQSLEFVQMAAQRGIGVFHKAPCGRNVREAQRLARLFAQQGRPLVVSRCWQFEPAFACLNDLTERGDRIYAAFADVRTVDTRMGWRGDSVRAGGGVLLNGAYDAVDLIVHLLGLPGSVNAQCSVAVPPGAARQYDTEDAAVLAMHFAKERIACITAMRGAAEPAWTVTLRCTRCTVEMGSDQLTVTPHGGESAQHHRVWTPHPVQCAISAFGDSQCSQEKRFVSTVEEHLPTLAVIEAAYLSARTGEPESPGPLLG